MLKKYWLIIIISGILVIGALYWYLNYQIVKTTPPPSVEEIEEAEEAIEETAEIEEIEKAEEEGIMSIPLEKPSFIK